MADPVRFQIFGKVAASRGSDSLDLRGYLGRATLVALLLHHDNPVGRDQVMDWVYAEGMSHRRGGSRRRLRSESDASVGGSDPDPRAAFANIVSQLKNGLESAPGRGDGIDVRDGLLSLRLGDRKCDMVEFRKLHEEGRRAADARDWPGAHAALAQALRIYEFPPFPELKLNRFPFLERFRDELEEEKYEARLVFLRAEIATGATDETVRELNKLTRERPEGDQDERAWEMLVEAVEGVEGSDRAYAAYRRAERAFEALTGGVPRRLKELGYEVNARAQGTSAVAATADPPTLQILSPAERPPSVHLPDVLTPGGRVEGFLSIWTKKAGTEVAHELLQAKRDAVTSVATGDFLEQRRIGEALAQMGEDAGLREVEAAGHYFAGEGCRLLADLVPEGVERRRLQSEATKRYQSALECDPDSVRPARGLARIYEVQGDLARAEQEFTSAYYRMFVLSAALPKDSPRSYELNHELLRVTRHRVHCLADLIETNPLSVWAKADKRDELKGLIAQSESLHKTLMPCFGAETDWWRIESFMGSVMLGKVWGLAGQRGQAYRALLSALWRRREMLNAERTLTSVELSNLQWWCKTAASSIDLSSDLRLHERIESLQAALVSADAPSVVAAVDDILQLNPV